MRVELGFIQTCSAVIFVLASFMAREVDSRLPPKLLKVASGAGKALYARGYGYSVIPIPQKILLQTNVARREVHHPRPARRAKRPRRGKRPPAPYAAKYQDYRPSRKRRPAKVNRPDPEYFDENDEDFEYQEFEDFVAKHSELYADGYNTRTKPPRGRYRDEDGAFSESSGFYARRPRPTRSGRPSTKLYSAAIAFPNRYQREEADYEEEEDDFYEYNKENLSDKGRYRGEEDEDERYYLRNRYRDWNPDDVYHDRTYETKQEKFRRAVEDKPKTKIQRKQQQDRNKKPKNSDIADRPLWPQENNQNKWKGPNDRDSQSNQNPYDKNRLKHVFFQDDQMKWEEPKVENMRLQPMRLDPIRAETIELGDQGRWRNPASLGIGQFYGKEPGEEPEIITKQNANRWEQRDPGRNTGEGFVKEHSVGYGIEIEGGGRKKKVEPPEPDVVYGQSGYSRPRVPDVGYGQGMELAPDKPPSWQVYLR